MITLVDYLTAAKEKISDPERWTQGTIAQTVYGGHVHSKHDMAVRWCAAGSYLSLTPSRVEEGSTYDKALYTLEDKTGIDIVEVNDLHGDAHSNVLKAYDKYISEAQKWNFV